MLALVVEPTTDRANHSRRVSDRESAQDPALGWPLLEDAIPSGAPMPITDEIEGRLNLDAHLVRNPDASFLVRVRGDALRDAGLHDGDLLVMDRAVPPLAGSVVLVADAQGVALRRLSRDAAGKLTVERGASRESSEGARPIQELDIWGVARWVVHRLWPNREPSPQTEPLSLRAVSAMPTTAGPAK